MTEKSVPKPIVVIVGQTASGKSALAMTLAEKYDGEIIAADSRTIYKGMDIGTAKPTLQDQQRIKHYGLDLIEPNETFSAAEFKRYASNVVKNVHEKNKLPIVVGGTGLYIDGYVYDFEFAPKADPRLRKELESLNINELQSRAEAIGLAPEQVDFNNPRHLSRAIERGGAAASRRHDLPSNVLLIGLKTDMEQLADRIGRRVSTMFKSGLMEEVKGLIDRYGEAAPGLQAPGYKAVIEYLNGRLNKEEAEVLFIRYDKNLAKRQNTWFKRNKDIVWCRNEHEANNNVRAFLSKFATIDS